MTTNHDALREAFNAFLLEQHERHKHQHNHFHVARNEWARRTQSTQFAALSASKPEPYKGVTEMLGQPGRIRVNPATGDVSIGIPAKDEPLVFRTNGMDRTEDIARACAKLSASERIKPEPQAQVGEPEVVAWVTDADVRDFGKGPGESAFCFTRHGKWNVALITLQSHREAMAKAHADLQEKALQYVALFGQLQDAREEIAKLHTALDACVDVDEYDMDVLSDLAATLEFRSPTRHKALTKAIAAITKAQEDRK